MNAEKIKLYEQEKKRSQIKYAETKDRSYLEDIFTLNQMIEVESTKELRHLSYVLLGIVMLVPVTIVLQLIWMQVR